MISLKFRTLQSTISQPYYTFNNENIEKMRLVQEVLVDSNLSNSYQTCGKKPRKFLKIFNNPLFRASKTGNHLYFPDLFYHIKKQRKVFQIHLTLVLHKLVISFKILLFGWVASFLCNIFKRSSSWSRPFQLRFCYMQKNCLYLILRVSTICNSRIIGKVCIHTSCTRHWYVEIALHFPTHASCEASILKFKL